MKIHLRLVVALIALTLVGFCVIDAQAKIPAHKQPWQFLWQIWLPSNWQSVARCETDTNWDHSNSSFVSAFGIQRGSHRGAYDHDARVAGMPRWSDVRPPTPWQQYRTALAHYRMHGDGWGCPGP